MALTWNLAQLVARFRTLIGQPSTSDISDTDLQDLINDYYVNHFPTDATVNEFDTFFTQALSATDDGEYTLDESVDRLDDPVTINGEQILLCRNREEFFESQHHHHFLHGFHSTGPILGDQFEDEQFITDPTLVIGTSNTARVLHSAFDYVISQFSYSKATSEVALTGSTVPQNKYGAWSLKIATDGTITVAAAGANGTGYDTPRKALEALGNTDGSSAYMGYVTVIETAAAGFIPDTTSLATGGTVTATFTDGKFEQRGQPTRALLYGTKLYVRPKPNDIYKFKGLQIADRPTALSGATEIADDKYGPMIAVGAAILYLNSIGDIERLKELDVSATYFQNTTKQDKIKRLLGQVVKRSF